MKVKEMHQMVLDLVGLDFMPEDSGIVYDNEKEVKKILAGIDMDKTMLMLAKGRLLGIQFIGLFDERKLYHKVSQHAIAQAMRIKQAFSEAGCKFRYDSPTNQQFPILPNDIMEKLGEKYAFSFWEKVDDNHTCVRFCTSWATDEKNVDTLIEDIKAVF